MKFASIICDPPWAFSNKGSRAAATDHYPTMPTRRIVQMPVEDWAADDAVLWLWVTDAHLPDGLEVMNAWGFTYKQTIAWVKWKENKLQIGMGNYLRHCHELLLLGTRGKPARQRADLPSVIMVPRGEHSEKPIQLHSLAMAFSPGPYLEIFARRPVQGWAAMGNQVNWSQPQQEQAHG